MASTVTPATSSAMDAEAEGAGAVLGELGVHP